MHVTLRRRMSRVRPVELLVAGHAVVVVLEVLLEVGDVDDVAVGEVRVALCRGECFGVGVAAVAAVERVLRAGEGTLRTIAVGEPEEGEEVDGLRSAGALGAGEGEEERDYEEGGFEE